MMLKIITVDVLILMNINIISLQNKKKTRKSILLYWLK